MHIASMCIDVVVDQEDHNMHTASASSDEAEKMKMMPSMLSLSAHLPSNKNTQHENTATPHKNVVYCTAVAAALCDCDAR